MTAGPPATAGPPVGERPGWMFAGLFSMTAVTGMVDASSYLGLDHTFTANMTGNVLLLGFAAAGSHSGQQLSALNLLVALCGFVLGVVVGTALVGRRPGPAYYRAAFGAEWVLLGGATVLVALAHPRVTVGRPSAEIIATAALLALAMGIQNAAVRRMGLPDVNTSVLTSALSGLASDMVTVAGRPANAGRRVATVGFLFLGALVGALIEHHGVWWSILGVLVLATAGIAILLRGRPDASAHGAGGPTGGRHPGGAPDPRPAPGRPS